CRVARTEVTEPRRDEDLRKPPRIFAVFEKEIFVFFISLRVFVVPALCVAGASCADAQRVDLRAIAHQNVLLVTIDTLRADALGCYGGPAVTPALDRLAADGVRFEFAHA